jgi:hypothetical protein
MTCYGRTRMAPALPHLRSASAPSYGYAWRFTQALGRLS